MKIIDKKILPEYFNPVVAKSKRFELRIDEDDIKIGDTVILHEWDGERFTGRAVTISVSYVLRNVPQYGLKEGYCIFGW